MPESPSPFDDPFADLFGKLPDPRTLHTRRAVGDPPLAGPTAPMDEDAGAHGGPEQPPLSRRAARAAVARETAPVETPSDPIGQVPQPADRVDAPQPADGAPAPQPANEAPAAAPAKRNPGRAVRPGSLEDLFTGKRPADDFGTPPPPPDKRKRRIGGWIALGVVLLLLGGIAGGGLWVWNTYEDNIREVMGWEEPKDYEAGLAHGEALVTVVSGDTGRPISETLHEAGVTKTPEAFYDYLISTSQNPVFQPGVFRLQQQMTSAAALEALMNPANKLENTAQLREGLTVAQSLPILAEATALPLADFEAAVTTPADYGVTADSLEGWLFPATYTFNPGLTAQDVVRTLVDRAVQSLDQAGVPVEDRQRILTVASIIQREARFEQDFYKVARVIENRLDPSNNETFGLLQMDSTAQYGYGELHDGTVSSSGEALSDDNPWNTYVHTGLPIGPISNPGDTAIDAAMHPADGPWLYFVTVNLDTGETVFTSTLAEHEQARAQWISWCKENPDAGC